MFENRIKPIENSQKTVTSMAQDRIRAAILDGILKPGSRIDQNWLAQELNISLVPVREALKKLEGEGFVQIIPRRGAFVTETSFEDMEELYFARRILEGQAGFHAAPRLSEETLTELDGVFVQMGEALDQRDFAAFNHLNRRFHFLIYDTASNRYLSNMILGLWDLAERYRYRYMFLKDQSAVIQSEHKAILDACHAHNSDQLQAAIVFHMNQTLNGIRTYTMQNDSEKP